MIRKEAFVIGLMSGTSLDGVDLVYVKFNMKKNIEFQIIHTQTIPYSSFWKSNLQNAIYFNKEELQELNQNYGIFLGEIINNFIENFSIKKVDFISSHGHTVLHEPEKGITLQVGSGQEITNITEKKVVCDFRSQDVRLGGQGAPLVPIGDELLFSEYDYCLNLGGFSNISFKENNSRIAFDICAVNIVLNFYANKIGLEYDESGEKASEGKINKELLKHLNQLDYYQQNPPKSLGLEWVQKEVFPLIDKFQLDVSSVLRTFVEHIAIQISKILSNNNSVLVTGGGVFNSFLMQRMEYHSNAKFKIVDSKLINFKEALIFAFLGLLKIDNQVNCLASVTGAKKDHSSGVVFSV